MLCKFNNIWDFGWCQPLCFGDNFPEGGEKISTRIFFFLSIYFFLGLGWIFSDPPHFFLHYLTCQKLGPLIPPSYFSHIFQILHPTPHILFFKSACTIKNVPINNLFTPKPKVTTFNTKNTYLWFHFLLAICIPRNFYMIIHQLIKTQQ